MSTLNYGKIKFKGGIKMTENAKQFNVKGEYTDTIRYADGTVEVIKSHNLIVDGLYKIITSLLSAKGGYSGLQYWAVGSGNPSWDSELPNPQTSDTRLTQEIGRKKIQPSDFAWVNASGEVQSTPTNRLRVRVTFSNSECDGAWREFGLFGGNATSTANSGIMMNHKNHPVVNKTSEMEIEREIIFTFSS